MGFYSLATASGSRSVGRLGSTAVRCSRDGRAAGVAALMGAAIGEGEFGSSTGEREMDGCRNESSILKTCEIRCVHTFISLECNFNITQKNNDRHTKNNFVIKKTMIILNNVTMNY